MLIFREKIFPIFYPPLENSTTRITIQSPLIHSDCSAKQFSTRLGNFSVQSTNRNIKTCIRGRSSKPELLNLNRMRLGSLIQFTTGHNSCLRHTTSRTSTWTKHADYANKKTQERTQYTYGQHAHTKKFVQQETK